MSQPGSSIAGVGVVGLGYVGLPLAIAFGRKFATVGYDLSVEKVRAYREHNDPTGQIARSAFEEAKLARWTNDPAELRAAEVIVVAVPTPIDAARLPDFGPLRAAAEAVGAAMRRGTTVVFESTVYPGATEEVCVPILERASRLSWKKDFFIGYSPERINPGDREHTLERIVKVVAGDTPATLEKLAALYGAVIPAGVRRASSIAAAEAAKVIENTQRDLNIAFVNELAIIFHRLGLDSVEVLELAGTKWNFLPFRPGLVGGHCIGVDPYYLTYKAEQAGYHPEVILAGRRINDGMGRYIAQETVKLLIQRGSAVKGAKASVLGLAFKENVPDLRNSRVIDIIRELGAYGVEVAVHDPVVDGDEARREYGLELRSWEQLPVADALILAVAHDRLLEKARELPAKVARGGCVVDVKSRLDPGAIRDAGLQLWRL
ncbi:MAG TPA: nucleotide sugar dehydrogenase [Burkholderiales bacterium]|nr:nucleotide sugar dehydrogenase [Burkholderiales bacterium]